MAESDCDFQTSHPPIPTVSIVTDTSQSGWGMTCSQHSLAGQWQLECMDHINVLELKVFCWHASVGLQTFMVSSSPYIWTTRQ